MLDLDYIIKRRKTFLTHPPPAVQHILKPCGLHYSVSNVLTVKKSAIAISSWASLLLLMSLDEAQSKPVRNRGLSFIHRGE